MKKKILLLPLGLFLLILLTFAYLLVIDRNPQAIPSNLINKKIPNFEASSLFKDEKFIFSQELKPEIVLINFFATWCKPCRDEHSFIQKFLDEKDLKIIGINYKDDSKKTKQWLSVYIAIFSTNIYFVCIHINTFCKKLCFYI